MRKKRVSQPLTASLAALIKKLAQENDELAQHQIAAQVEVNQGRVSEVLTGKKFAETQPQ